MRKIDLRKWKDHRDKKWSENVEQESGEIRERQWRGSRKKLLRVRSKNKGKMESQCRERELESGQQADL